MAHPESSAFICLSPDLKQRQYWKKIQEAVWVSFFFMTREKKCLSSSSFFSGFLEVRRKVQPPGQAGFWGWWFRAVLGTCGSVRSPLVPTCVPPLVLPPLLEGASWTPLLLIFLWPGLLEPSKRNLNGLPELIDRILSWNLEGPLYF